MNRFLKHFFYCLLLALSCGAGLTAYGASGGAADGKGPACNARLAAGAASDHSIGKEASSIHADLLLVSGSHSAPFSRTDRSLPAFDVSGPPFFNKEVPIAAPPLPAYRFQFSVATSDYHRFLFRLTPF